MKKIVRIVEYLEDSSLLPEGVSKTIQNGSSWFKFIGKFFNR